MRALLPSFTGKYVAHLIQRTVPDTVHPFYLKWLRYYLDFCEKYQFSHGQVSSLPHFLHKLQEKKQSPAQQHQARHAITLYYQLL